MLLLKGVEWQPCRCYGQNDNCCGPTNGQRYRKHAQQKAIGDTDSGYNNRSAEDGRSSNRERCDSMTWNDVCHNYKDRRNQVRPVVNEIGTVFRTHLFVDIDGDFWDIFNKIDTIIYRLNTK